METNYPVTHMIFRAFSQYRMSTSKDPKYLILGKVAAETLAHEFHRMTGRTSGENWPRMERFLGMTVVEVAREGEPLFGH